MYALEQVDKLFVKPLRDGIIGENNREHNYT